MATKASALAAQKEDEITAMQWERYVRARDNGHTKYVALAKKCDKYYVGIQWDENDVLMLGSRPHLTINEILPTINAVLAEQSQRRCDVQFKPTKGGTQEIANVLNKVFEFVANTNKLDWIEQQVFADGLIMDGRGYFDCRMDFKTNVQGDIRIKALDPLDVLIDPDAKDQNPETWNEVFTTRWNTLDDIENVYGQKKADQLKSMAESGITWGEDSIEWREQRYGSTEGHSHASYGKEDYRNIKRLRVIERQYYKIARKEYFVDDITGDQRPVPEGWDDKKIKKFARSYGLSVVSQVEKRVRWTVTCDKTVLHDDWSPYKRFTVVPYFAYFRRGQPFGMVRNLLSPQEQLNKVSSQELHIVNTTANSGWVIENGSLSNLKPEELEQVGATTGLVIEYNRGSTAPIKIEPNRVPSGLDRISQKAQANIKSISGVGDMMLNGDASTDDVTNPLQRLQRNRGTIMAQVPLDNLTKSRQNLAELILEMIQTFMTEQRLLHITNDNDPLHPREPMMINEMTPEGKILNDLTQGSYDVMMTTVPAKDTFDDVQFLEALSLKSIGVVIPDDALIEYSHLARKGELAKRVRQMTGVEKTPEQEQMEQMMQEIQMQGLQLNLQELQMKIQKLQSEAMLNQAKSQDLAQTGPQIEIAKLQTELEARTRELDLRRELATMAAASRDNQAQTGAAVKIATTAMSTAARREQQADKLAAQGAKKSNG